MRNLFKMCCLPYLYDLKQNVVAYAAEVTAETWKKVGQNFCVCVKACFNRNAVHIEPLDYKKLVWLLNIIRPH